MNMASIRIFFFVSSFVGTACFGFVTVKCKTENVGQYGQQILVDCVIQPTQEAADAEVRVVTWKKKGDKTPLLFFNRDHFEERRERYSFAEPSWNNKNRNVSLLIDNAAVEDEGEYECAVLTDRGDGKEVTSLKIRAKNSRLTVKSIPGKITGNTDVLMCTSEGGYPQGQLRWFDEHGEDWSKSAKMKAVKMKDGRFHLTSNLTLLPGSTFSKYTCVVFNSTGAKEEEFLFEMNKGKSQELEGDKGMNSPSKIVAPVVVIGSLIVGLLLTLFIIRLRRTRHARRQSAVPLMDGPVRTHDSFHAMQTDNQDMDVEKGDEA